MDAAAAELEIEALFALMHSSIEKTEVKLKKLDRQSQELEVYFDDCCVRKSIVPNGHDCSH